MKNNKAVPDIESFIKFLGRNKLKTTPQRLAVHEAMMELGHASADMVCDFIKAKGNRTVTAASVYNILSQMSLLGLYQHRMSANNKMYFDVRAGKHIHLYDTENNTYTDIADEDLYSKFESLLTGRRFKGYKVDGLDIQVLCHPSRSKVKA